ncbi:DNA-3-methyladenine glycosylase isoform X3 [Phyllopteryx taeniolatus]|uniref:DNA-3-methyladenine glycosylase isoform X3 n=1 Tax=Phyllopteryx taeniolatus TaxID=161469 RepID=UPI002AD5346C|nr:DNA-3-methyladenine glycosylase isoform X3 [Phyllopteryx taeniolatus]
MRYIMAEHKRTLPSRKGDQKANKRVNESELAAESKQLKLNETTTVVQSVDLSGGQNAEMRRRLGEDFFTQPCVALAKAFLGKVLVRRREDGTELRGRVVETEAYLGGEDKASHSAGGKRTERNTAMFMKPGAIYVYPIYGVYLCMNVSSEGRRDGAAVLLRSLEPLQGHAVMRQLRAARRKDGARPLKDKELCNGPSKLCQALDVPRRFDRRDLATDPEMFGTPSPPVQSAKTARLMSSVIFPPPGSVRGGRLESSLLSVCPLRNPKTSVTPIIYRNTQGLSLLCTK